ncbi:single stranded DNA binding protein [Geobacillus phage TP-84]|uniref:Single-stranded DNA-binding protein n=1 Tax=Geobacillus phage TP-84 TaxID=1965361 RepID=A0A1U9WQM3_9CAUD|nr:single strand DNA binding protein [Geobacillus phage TP-84]AQY55081.1 single stranded DNA binding protein [Geobacillus phage TP-84]
MNNVTLVGRLTNDVELRYTQQGKAVATFNLAVQREFKNQDNVYEVDFPQIVVWGKPAETLANYTKKGSLIGITGRLQTRSYERQDGSRVYVTEVVANNVRIYQWKDSGQGGQSRQGGSQPQGRGSRYPDPYGPYDGDPFANDGEPIYVNDDDLPF